MSNKAEPQANTTDRQKESRNDLVFSYKTLRNLIGFSGMLLPVILALYTLKEEGDKLIEPSISDYYYTSNGDIFVVILSVLAVFLFCYNGYNWKEKLWTILAAVCGIGVAFCPTDTKYIRHSLSVHSPHTEGPKLFGFEWHFVFAILFFISLSIISLYYFPMSDKKLTRKPGEKRTPKEKRNLVYKICGWTMISCVVILALYFLIPSFNTAVGNFPMIFTFEAIAVEAFAVSWLTKGETFWPDGEHYIVSTYKEIKRSI
ncbi:MAG: hypothetical protein ABI543_06320 [Ignavibacteria bacterium]